MTSCDIVLKSHPKLELPKELVAIFHTVPELRTYFKEDSEGNISLPARHDKYFVAAVKLASLVLKAGTADNPFYIETIPAEKYAVLESDLKEIVVLESELQIPDTPSDQTEFLKLEDISDLLHAYQIHPDFDYYRLDDCEHKLPSPWVVNPHIKRKGYYFYRPTVDIDHELINGKYKVIDVTKSENLTKLFATEVRPIRTLHRRNSIGILDRSISLITSNFILITDSGAAYGIQYYAMDYDFAGLIRIPDQIGLVFSEQGVCSDSNEVKNFANLVVSTVVSK